MQRGLLLLILLLLAGGYFFFVHGGSHSVVATPQLVANASLAQGDGSYVVFLQGKLDFPGSGDYNVSTLRVTLLLNGNPVQTKDLGGSSVSGPGSYPFSYKANVPYSVSSAALKVDANVVHGSDVYSMSTEVPVALPDRSAVARPPYVALSLKSVERSGSEESAVLSIYLYNPNSADISIKDLKLSDGSKTYDLGPVSLKSKEGTTLTQSISVAPDTNSVTLTLSGTFSVLGVDRAFNQSFTIFVPTVPVSPLIPRVGAKYVGVAADGYEFNVYGSIYNPNAFPVHVDALELKVLSKYGDSNVLQSVTLAENKDILPQSSLKFSKIVKINALFSSAVAELVLKHDGKTETIATIPVGVLNPSDLISAPRIYLKREVNCSFVPSVHNPNGYALTLDMDVKLDVNGNTSTLASYTNKGLAANADVDLDPFEVNASGLFTLEVVGKAGIPALGIWVPFDVAVDENC